MRSDVVPGAAFPDYELHIVGAVRGTAIGGHGESVALRCDDTLDAWRVMLLPTRSALRRVSRRPLPAWPGPHQRCGSS